MIVCASYYFIGKHKTVCTESDLLMYFVCLPTMFSKND